MLHEVFTDYLKDNAEKAMMDLLRLLAGSMPESHQYLTTPKLQFLGPAAKRLHSIYDSHLQYMTSICCIAQAHNS